MLEMNRNEFQQALEDAKKEHEAELAALTKSLNSQLATLQDELKTERAEKASALQQVNQLAAPHGVAAPIGDSPRTLHIAQLEDTLSNLRLEIERRDAVDAEVAAPAAAASAKGVTSAAGPDSDLMERI